MKLTELFTGKTNMDGTAQVNTKQYASTADLNRQIRSLVPGQTLHGEIVGRNGSEIQIKLAEDMVLNARVDQSINLEMGRMLTFEVKNNGAALTLSPLFTNVATDINMLKALDMAGLPVNETSLEMARQLMEAGLPVNRATLQQVYREIHAFPENEISDVINLHKLQMPVNEANMNQMASYRNLTYQLTSAMDTVLELIPQAAEQMLAEGKVQEAANLLHHLFVGVQEAWAQSPLETGAEGNLPPLQGNDLPANLPEGNLPEGGVPSAGAGAAESQEAASGAQAQEGVPGRALPEVSELPLSDAASQEIAEQLEQVVGKLALSPEERQAFTEQIQAFSRGAADVREVFGLAEALLEAAARSGQETSVIKAFWGQKSLRSLLAEQVKTLWSIKPEDVASPEKVEALYRSLDSQLRGLSQVLEAGGQAESGAAKAVLNLSQNIDFMQQLNQLYAYVQLPLRLEQGRAHGDLYVYANRKSLAAADGQVSALLHLDMEHLGAVDVYVALQDTKVSTKFYVQDDSMLDFMAEHMDLLTERLKKRGYDCSCSLTTRGMPGESPSGKGLEPILQQDRGIMLANYSFDVRT